ncbi:DUF5654 family protein [Methanobrevibacter filiformis]|uniref:Uncharacterized protein n=1 Tax=Methanobrevibacter filiformis TaxID=55758 RepID=A0A166DM81_9EURY|nr:DUF5654 family protein [Methanobrevibacter filiformis]KZX15749.1 hypothetical protein MBFIL_06130 [Methanobrevibacter filiformis]
MVNTVKVETLKTLGKLITTAFALVAGLAWNSAIQAIIKQFLEQGSAVLSMVVYAIVVTIIAVIITVFFGRALGKLGIDLDD